MKKWLLFALSLSIGSVAGCADKKPEDGKEPEKTTEKTQTAGEHAAQGALDYVLRGEDPIPEYKEAASKITGNAIAPPRRSSGTDLPRSVVVDGPTFFDLGEMQIIDPPPPERDWNGYQGLWLDPWQKELVFIGVSSPEMPGIDAVPENALAQGLIFTLSGNERRYHVEVAQLRSVSDHPDAW